MDLMYKRMHFFDLFSFRSRCTTLFNLVRVIEESFHLVLKSL
jgi:hypothetical protein